MDHAEMYTNWHIVARTEPPRKETPRTHYELDLHPLIKALKQNEPQT